MHGIRSKAYDEDKFTFVNLMPDKLMETELLFYKDDKENGLGLFVTDKAIIPWH
jgi:hypothetical protein